MGEAREWCDTCKFWQKSANQMGYCRRFPPTLLIVAFHEETRWPETKVYDWCGEHIRLKPAKDT